MNAKKIEELFYKYLYPQNSSAEIFLASLLLLFSYFYNQIRYSAIAEIDPRLSPAIFLCMIIPATALTISTRKIFFGINRNEGLKFLQRLGTFVILIISFFYSFFVIGSIIYTKAGIVLIDYFVLVLSGITILRGLFIYADVKYAKGDEIDKYMPDARNLNIHPIIIILVSFVSLLLLLQESKSAMITLGRAYYLGVFVFGIINSIDVFKKKIFFKN